MTANDDLKNLRAHTRALDLIGGQVRWPLLQVTKWHRRLAYEVDQGRRQPRIQDFAGSYFLFAHLEKLFRDAATAEMQTAHRYSSWAEIGGVVNLTRQGAQQRFRAITSTPHLRESAREVTNLGARVDPDVGRTHRLSAAMNSLGS